MSAVVLEKNDVEGGGFGLGLQIENASEPLLTFVVEWLVSRIDP